MYATLGIIACMIMVPPDFSPSSRGDYHRSRGLQGSQIRRVTAWPASADGELRG